jgi:hypothetical protein
LFVTQVPYKVPPFTLPFNIALLTYLLASANMHRFDAAPVRGWVILVCAHLRG